MITESFPTDVWHNIFHATISGNLDVHGSRIPAIYISQENGNMITSVSCAVNGTISYFGIPSAPIQFNKWIAIIVSQTKVKDEYHHKVEVNGEVLYMGKNSQPQEFENVKIYISDPWYPALPGYVRNVYMKGKV